MSRHEKITNRIDEVIASNELPDGYTRPLLKLVESKYRLEQSSDECERTAAYALAHIVACLMTVVMEKEPARIDRRSTLRALSSLGGTRFHEERQGRVLQNAPIWRLAMRAADPAMNRADRNPTEFSAVALHMIKRAAEAYLGELLEHAVSISRLSGKSSIEPADIKTVCRVQLLRPSYFVPYA